MVGGSTHINGSRVVSQNPGNGTGETVSYTEDGLCWITRPVPVNLRSLGTGEIVGTVTTDPDSKSNP